MFLKSHKHFYFKGRDKQCSWWGLRWQTCQKFQGGFFFFPNRLLRRNAQLACCSLCISSGSFWWVIWGHGLESFQSRKDECILEHMKDDLERQPSSYTKQLTRVQFPDLKSRSSPCLSLQIQGTGSLLASVVCTCVCTWMPLPPPDTETQKYTLIEFKSL